MVDIIMKYLVIIVFLFVLWGVATLAAPVDPTPTQEVAPCSAVYEGPVEFTSLGWFNNEPVSSSPYAPDGGADYMTAFLVNEAGWELVGVGFEIMVGPEGINFIEHRVFSHPPLPAPIEGSSA